VFWGTRIRLVDAIDVGREHDPLWAHVARQVNQEWLGAGDRTALGAVGGGVAVDHRQARCLAQGGHDLAPYAHDVAAVTPGEE